MTSGIMILRRGLRVVSERWLVSLSLGCSVLYGFLPLAVDTIADCEPAMGPKGGG
jgi:hypothetical protein